MTSHPTSVVHPSIPIGKPNIIASAAAAEQFGLAGKRLPPGSFASPVKMANLDVHPKGFGEMEKPVFISKGQKNLSTTKKNKGRHGVPLLPGQHSAPITNTVVKASQLGKLYYLY